MSRSSLRWASLAVALLVVAGCTGEEPAPSSQRPEPAAAEPTPLDRVDTTDVALAAADPCPALDEEAVVRALGDEVAETATWSPGERAPLARGVDDVAHETGCAFLGPAGTEVRAWVFAPPISPERARRTVRAMAGQEGCDRGREATGFGSPGIGRVCAGGRVVTASYGGLFGETWLGCSVTVPSTAARGEAGRTALRQRGGQWCVHVLDAAQAATDALEQ